MKLSYYQADHSLYGCEIIASLTLHQREKISVYLSRLDRLEYSSNTFLTTSQIWSLFQSHGVLKNCLLGTDFVCHPAWVHICVFRLFSASWQMGVGWHPWGHLLVPGCADFGKFRNSSLAARRVFLQWKIAAWLRSRLVRMEDVCVPPLCTGSLAVSNKHVEVCPSPAPCTVMSRARWLLLLWKLSGRCCDSSALFPRCFLWVR